MTVRSHPIRPGFLGRAQLPTVILLCVLIGVPASAPLLMVTIVVVEAASPGLGDNMLAAAVLMLGPVLLAIAGTAFFVFRERNRQIETAGRLQDFWVDAETALTSEPG